jgi:glycosyltransferase involved in cell wall biosynthesis
MTRNDRVSVAICNRNYGKLLPGALDSAAAEKPSIIALCDDGSTDDSVDVVMKGLESPRQEIVSGIPCVSGTWNGTPLILAAAEVGRGLAPARNVALKISWDKADFFAILDADDRFLPGRLDKCLSMLNKYGEIAGAVYTDYYHVRGEDEVLSHHCKTSFDKKRLFFENIVHSACVVRKTALDEVGCYSEDMDASEDYELWMKIASKRIILHIPEVTMLVKEGPWQFSRNTSSQKWVKYNKIARDRHCKNLLS